VKKIAFTLLLVLAATSIGLAEQTSFRSVKLPHAKGKPKKAVLTFSDSNKAVEVRPAKGGVPVSIPYGQIDKCAYEYTTELTLVLTEAKNHWLEIDYHDQDAHKVLLLQMEKKDYLHILDAVKNHTGNDVEILGNADKRHEKIWHK
jgi:hypothetical protein